MAKKTLKIPPIVTSVENDMVPELEIKKLQEPRRTNSETSQDAINSNSSPQNRRRSKRFEDALLKWQEYGNDIIERKQPNFLELKNKHRKGTWIYAGGKHNEKSEVEETRKANERDKVYQKQVNELAGRLGDNLREFQEMRERSAKIELTLKQLKEKAMVNVENERDFKT